MIDAPLPYALTMESPVGLLTLRGDGQALREILFSPAEKLEGSDAPDPAGILAAAREQLTAYFAGRLREFNLPLVPAGTSFQQRVWQQLQTIPYGKTLTYGELAGLIGNPRACRAVGLANGANPLPIVIPCHRVIGAGGRLTGYGGGLDRKQILLSLEQRVMAQGSR